MMSVVMKHAVKPDYRLKEDEYLNDDGFAYCKNCHTPRQYRFTLEGRTLIVHAACNCKDEKQKRSCLDDFILKIHYSTLLLIS